MNQQERDQELRLQSGDPLPHRRALRTWKATGAASLLSRAFTRVSTPSQAEGAEGLDRKAIPTTQTGDFRCEEACG